MMQFENNLLLIYYEQENVRSLKKKFLTWNELNPPQTSGQKVSSCAERY